MSTAHEVPAWTLGDRLRKALNVRDNIKVTDMARILGVERQTVGNYINGRTKPPLSAVRVWASHTGVDLEWLAGDDYELEAPRIHGLSPSVNFPLFDPGGLGLAS